MREKGKGKRSQKEIRKEDDEVEKKNKNNKDILEIL